MEVMYSARREVLMVCNDDGVQQFSLDKDQLPQWVQDKLGSLHDKEQQIEVQRFVNDAYSDEIDAHGLMQPYAQDHVEYTGTVHVDMTRIIHPSMGLLDIEAGEIKVVDIRVVEDMDEDTLDMVQTVMTPNLSTDIGDQETWEVIKDEYWVRYEYKKASLEADMGPNWLPLSTFTDHVTTY